MKNNEEKERSREEEKLEPGEIDTEGTAVSWFSNFWYYHKWKLLLTVFVTVVVTICTMQMCSRENADVTIIYAGSCYLQDSNYPKVQAVFEKVLPGDYNGDGDKVVDIASKTIYSEEQIEKIKSETDEDIGLLLRNNQADLRAYDNLIMAGEYSIVICEPWLYKRVASAGGFRKLSDVLGYVPEQAADDYSIRFADLPLAEENSELFKYFTDDTVIALRTVSQIGTLTGKKRSEKIYSQSVELFKAIVEYGPEETAG